ncbi:MAG: DNA polymerase III subunit beta [Bacteroidota bacterium]|nr:DNA polymerase III subunit beta [Bacteroidota bacterium]
MKFIVSSSKLLKQLQLIGGIIQSNNTLPILDNFLFELKQGELTVSASDLETTMSVNLEVETQDTGSAAVPAKVLMDTLKTFPEQPLTFTFEQKSHTIELSSDYGKYSLAFIDGDEFPKFPEIEDSTSAVLPAEVLVTAIGKTLFATGNDELRPVMSGVFFQFDSNSLTFVATDAHKLVRYRRTDLGAESTAEFIMPRKPLNMLRGAMSYDSTEVQVTYNSTNAQFSFDNVVMVCRLIDGKYPNYEAVIPQSNPNVMLVDCGAFSSSVKRVAIFSNKTTHQIRLRIAGAEMGISAEDPDFSNKANERLSCDYQGDDIEIGFNSRFLFEMLGNLGADNVRMELSAPNRAGILIPADSVDEGEDLLMLVMPVMLNH